MKKLNLLKTFLFFFVSVLVLGCAFACTGGGDDKKEKEAIKKFDASALKVYSMDLSDISGYESYVVEKGTWQETMM